MDTRMDKSSDHVNPMVTLIRWNLSLVHIKVNSLIDMEVGPDGKLYLLEYGTGWFTKNPDAGLSRIDYNGGNSPPMISGIHVDKTSGILPFYSESNG